MVVLGHAMMVDRCTLDRPAGQGLASTLYGRGLDVTWMDARGHGESGPTADQGGRFSYDDIVRFDVPALVSLGRELARGRPLVLLGHSLIGHAALISAGLDPDAAPDAIVAYAPNLWRPGLERSPIRRMQKRLLLAGLDVATRTRGYFDSRRFGLGNTPEPAPYIRQFTQMWRDDRLGHGGLGQGDVDYEQALGRADVDLLAVSSQNDRLLATIDSVGQFIALAGNARVESVVLRGNDAPTHMGFVTDPRSHSLWNMTANWILQHAG